MCDGVSSASWTISSARSVSIGGDAGGLERLVEADLLGRHRLHLDDLGGAGGADQLGDDRAGLGRVAGPVHGRARPPSPPPRTAPAARAAGRSTSSLIAAPATRSASQSGTSPTTRSRLSRIVWVARRRFARSCASASSSRAAAGNGSPRDDVAAAMLMTGPPGSRRSGSAWPRPAAPGQAAADVGRGRSCRRRPRTRRPCPRPRSHLSASIAPETPAFFTANVPPKPQHSSAPGSVDQLQPAHRAQQPPRPVAQAQHAQAVAGRVVGHPVREGRRRRRSRRARRRAARTARRCAARSRPPGGPAPRRPRPAAGTSRGPSPRTSRTGRRPRRTPRTSSTNRRTSGSASAR